MEYDFNRSGSGSYLVFREEKLTDGYVRKMLEKAAIPALLEERIIQTGGGCELHYRISGMQTLEKSYARKKMRTSDAAALLEGIVRLQSICAAYLLPDCHLFLSPDLIYVSYLNTDFRFLYLPEEETTSAEQVRILADFMMKHIAYDSDEDAGVELVYGLQDAAGREGFVLADWWRMQHGRYRQTAADQQKCIRGAFPAEGTGSDQTVRDAASAGRCNVGISDTQARGIWRGTKQHAGTDAVQSASDSPEIVPLTGDRDLRRKDDPYADMEAGGFFPRRRSKKEKKNRGKRDKKEKNTGQEEQKRGTEKGSGREDGNSDMLFGHSAQDRKRKHRTRRRKKEKRTGEHMYADTRAQDETISWYAMDGWESTPAAGTFAFASAGSILREAGPDDNRTGETVLLSEHADTAAQNTDPARLHALIPMNGGKEIPLDRSFFLVGASARNADIVIEDPTVSRIHAEIFCDEDGIRIEDCNSSNGTMVDGQMLGPNEQKPLEPGMHIRMGRTEFVFR